MRIDSADDPVATLAQEIEKLPEDPKEILKRFRDRLFDTGSPDEPKNLCYFAEVVSYLSPNFWMQGKYYDATIDTLRQAIGNRPNEAVIGGSESSLGEETHVTWQQLMWVRLNLDQIDLGGVGRRDSYLKNEARQLCKRLDGSSPTTRSLERYTEKARRCLAESLLKILSEEKLKQVRQEFDNRASHFSAPVEVSRQSPPFIHRTMEQDKVRHWINSRTQVLLIAGDSGNGKSSIAIETLKEILETDFLKIIRIDASTEYSLSNSVGVYITQCDGFDISRSLSEFSIFLRSLPLLSILLIDNAPDWESIEPMVMSSHRTIITSEERIVPTDVRHAVMRVDAPDVKVAARIVQWFRPDESNQAAERFALAVGLKPRIIVDCLSMFTQDDMALDQMRECITGQDAQLVTTAGADTRSVNVLYAKYFKRIEATQPVVAICLAIVAHLNQSVLPKSIAAGILSQAALSRRLTVSTAGATVALRTLESRFLVELNEREISMHGISMQLFREVSDHYGKMIRKATLEAYVKERKTIEPVSMDTTRREWVPSVLRVVLHSPRSELDVLPKGLLGALSLDLHHGLVQIGRYEGFRDYVSHLLDEFGDLDIEELVGESEYLAWFASIFDNGFISRKAALRVFKTIYNDGQFVGTCRRIEFEFIKASVQYKFKDFLAWIGGAGLRLSIGEGVHVDDKCHAHVLHMKALALAHVGRIAEAEECLRKVILEHSDMLDLAGEIVVSSYATAWSSLCRDSYRMAQWYDYISRCYLECRDDYDDIEELAFVAISEGWYFRYSDDDRARLDVARGKFAAAADLLLRTGARRYSLAVYLESYAIQLYLIATGEVNHGPSEMGVAAEFDTHVIDAISSLAEQIDEPHSINRLRLLEALSEWVASGSNSQLLSRLERIMIDADERFEDCRTATQAAASIMYVRHAMGLDDEDIHEYLRCAFRCKYMLSDPIPFNAWLKDIRDSPAKLLLL
ncbi:hypothetical protein [Nocardia sp. CC201C]|uniref:hypothetical protein n=1 Tax=Nocardia sp. CC201C TaxID=3044575 RepID=UPI0024A905DC|nr:hypothetical protein [Nocardia sp. CC201C]